MCKTKSDIQTTKNILKENSVKGIQTKKHIQRVQVLIQLRKNYGLSIHIGVCIVSSPDEDIRILCDHARIAQQIVK